MGKPIALRVLDESHVRDRLGRPLRDLRISLIDRCNYRCPYCMPEDRYPRDAQFLAARERLAAAEIERLVRLFVAEGAGKIRLTGGEPLLRRDLPEIVARIASIEGVRDLALTTNGALLAPCAEELKAAGLGRITVSLDALDPEQFRRMSGGRGCVADVLEGIAAAEAVGFGSLKINCVVQRGANEDAVLPLAARFRGTPHVLRFIEYMDVGTCNGWRLADVVTAAELRTRIGARWAIEPVEAGYRGEVAQRWRYADGAGEIGFVASVSAPFCGDCHRARLSADGKLYTCLFAAHGHDLRAPLRAGEHDAELAHRIRSAWSARSDRYSELRGAATGRASHVEMYRIGG